MIDETPEIRWSYQASQYELLIREPQWWAGIVGPATINLPEYRLVTTLLQLTAADGLHGVVYDWQDWNNFTLLILKPSESLLGLFRISNGEAIVYQAPTTHPAVAVGLNWHEVQIERLFGRTVIWIDDVKVVDVPFGTSMGPMRFGYYLESGNLAPVALRADDVAIYALPSDYEPANLPQPDLTAPLAAYGSERGIGTLFWEAQGGE